MALEHLRLFRRPNTAPTPGGGDGSSLLFQRCVADYHKQKRAEFVPRYSQEVQKDKALCAQLTCSGSFDSRVYNFFYLCLAARHGPFGKDGPPAILLRPRQRLCATTAAFARGVLGRNRRSSASEGGGGSRGSPRHKQEGAERQFEVLREKTLTLLQRNYSNFLHLFQKR